MDKKITREILGKARISYTKKLEKELDEVFFTIEKKRKYGKGYELAKKCGYICMTDGMEAIFDTLFKDRSYNRSIAFIEWDNCYNVVFEDGICISSKTCRMETEDFETWEKTIVEEK